MNINVLKRFIQNKQDYARGQKVNALKHEDGTDIYWDGVINTCEDIKNFIEKTN